MAVSCMRRRGPTVAVWVKEIAAVDKGICTALRPREGVREVVGSTAVVRREASRATTTSASSPALLGGRRWRANHSACVSAVDVRSVPAALCAGVRLLVDEAAAAGAGGAALPAARPRGKRRSVPHVDVERVGERRRGVGVRVGVRGHNGPRCGRRGGGYAEWWARVATACHCCWLSAGRGRDGGDRHAGDDSRTKGIRRGAGPRCDTASASSPLR